MNYFKTIKYPPRSPSFPPRKIQTNLQRVVSAYSKFYGKA